MNLSFCRLCVLASALTVSASAGLIINPTFNDAQFAADGYTPTQIAAIHQAFNAAAAEIAGSFSDNIHVNINVTSGVVGLGQSSTNLFGYYTYASMVNALNLDATTANDTSAVLHLPGSDPAGTNQYVVARAQAKALGIVADDLITDGTFTFDKTQQYTFDPLNRAVSGKFDFIGVAQHEISEIMGRGGYGINNLYRYTAPGVLNLATSATGVYFSIDGGVTNLAGFNSTPGADLADYNGSNPSDPFNAFTAPGGKKSLSLVGLQNLDVIGYNLQASSVPEPSSFALIGLGAFGLAAYRRRKG